MHYPFSLNHQIRFWGGPKNVSILILCYVTLDHPIYSHFQLFPFSSFWSLPVCTQGRTRTRPHQIWYMLKLYRQFYKYWDSCKIINLYAELCWYNTQDGTYTTSYSGNALLHFKVLAHFKPESSPALFHTGRPQPIMCPLSHRATTTDHMPSFTPDDLNQSQ